MSWRLFLYKIVVFIHSVSLLFAQASEIFLPSRAKPCVPMPKAGNNRLGILVVFAPHPTLSTWIFLFHKVNFIISFYKSLLTALRHFMISIFFVFAFAISFPFLFVRRKPLFPVSIILFFGCKSNPNSPICQRIGI